MIFLLLTLFGYKMQSTFPQKKNAKHIINQYKDFEIQIIPQKNNIRLYLLIEKIEDIITNTCIIAIEALKLDWWTQSIN